MVVYYLTYGNGLVPTYDSREFDSINKARKSAMAKCKKIGDRVTIYAMSDRLQRDERYGVIEKRSHGYVFIRYKFGQPVSNHMTYASGAIGKQII